MDASSLADGLTYRGEMTAVRQTYYIFEARDYYFVMSFSGSKPHAGNFNIVGKKAVDYVFHRFSNEKNVTAKAVVKRSKRTKHAASSLVALNILYVLAATGVAGHRVEGPHRELRFSIKKVRPNQPLHLIKGHDRLPGAQRSPMLRRRVSAIVGRRQAR
jgi:hypothetical protein